jgi:hypothetical protein
VNVVKFVAVLICSAASLLALAGCGSSSTGGGGSSTVSSITVSPATGGIDTGTTQQFTATAKDANGTTMAGVTFTWSSSSTAVATISSAGLAGAVTAGTTNITASASGVTSPAVALTVSQATAATGTVAHGSPVAGATVTLKDAQGTTRTATSGTDGKFSVRTTGLTPPFLVQVPLGGGGTLYSVSAETDANTTINVTPLSDTIVRAWYGVQNTPVSADSAFADPTSHVPPSPAGVQSLAGVVQNVVQSYLTNASVPASFNFISSPFTADSTGFDKALDQVGLTTIGANGNTIAIKAAAGTVTQNSTLTLTPGTVTVATTTTGGSGGASSSSVTSTAVPVTSAQQSAQTAIATLLANFAGTINTKGSSLAASDLQAYTDPSLLNEGLNQGQFLASLVTQFGGSSGRTVSLSIVQLKTLDTTNNVADEIIQVAVTQAGQTRNDTTEFFFRNINGNWLMSGDQRIGSVNLAAQYSTQILPPCPNTCTQEPAQGLVLSSNIGVPNAAAGGLGLASPPTISGGTGGLLSNAVFTDAGQDTNSSPLRELYYFAYPPLSTSTPLDPTKVPAGTPFTITLTPATGSPASYTLVLNSWTTDPVVLTAPTSTALAGANLGGSLTVSWTLPTTYAIAEIQLSATGQETANANGSQCTFGQGRTPSWPVVGNTSITATIKLPTTCPDGNPIVTVDIDVTTIGVNGEQSSAQILMQ